MHPWSGGKNYIGFSLCSNVIPMSCRFSFDYINDMNKYEVFILGLKVAIILKMKKIKVYSDSQMVVKKINGIYNTNNEKL